MTSVLNSPTTGSAGSRVSPQVGGAASWRPPAHAPPCRQHLADRLAAELTGRTQGGRASALRAATYRYPAITSRYKKVRVPLDGPQLFGVNCGFLPVEATMSTDTRDPTPDQPRYSRRQALRRFAAIGAASVWAVPVVQRVNMLPAYAHVSPPPGRQRPQGGKAHDPSGPKRRRGRKVNPPGLERRQGGKILDRPPAWGGPPGDLPPQR